MPLGRVDTAVVLSSKCARLLSLVPAAAGAIGLKGSFIDEEGLRFFGASY